MAIVALPPGELYEGKWRIADPSKIAPVPRTEFLQGLCGEYEHSTPLEEMDLSRKRDPKAALLRQLQGWYKQIKAINGRLPKFSKWCSGLLPNDKDLQQYISKLGQEAIARKIVISGDAVDILRAGATAHFYSCLRWEDRAGKGAVANWDHILGEIVEKYPGIAVVYIDDPATGTMLSRSFLLHAKNKETGEDLAVIQNPYNVAMTLPMIAGLFGDRAKAYKTSAQYGDPPATGKIDAEYVGCFKESVHFDIQTWQAGTKLVPINL